MSKAVRKTKDGMSRTSSRVRMDARMWEGASNGPVCTKRLRAWLLSFAGCSLNTRLFTTVWNGNNKRVEALAVIGADCDYDISVDTPKVPAV